MDYAWPNNLLPQNNAVATFMPPATVEESAWDMLLALHSDECRGLGLDRLANLVSLPRQVVDARLALLEERGLVTGIRHDELRAVLTPVARELLDRYWSAAGGLQVGVHH